MERKSINFELKDLDRNKRTAIIAHAVYDNIDFAKDISRKGMFTKSWNENKDIVSFYLNHNDEQAPGKVVELYEDNQQAYTKAWLGTHTLGNDVLTMMDEGVIKKASFGFLTLKSNPINVKGQKIRELKEVFHLETSVLTKLPANIKAGVQQVTKSFSGLPELKTLSSSEQAILQKIALQDQQTIQDLAAITANMDPKSDLYIWVGYAISRRADMMSDVRGQLRYNSSDIAAMKSYVAKMEKFCHNTSASDDCIKSILEDIEETKNLISEYNTASTRFEQDASVRWNGWLNSINHLKTN